MNMVNIQQLRVLICAACVVIVVALVPIVIHTEVSIIPKCSLKKINRLEFHYKFSTDFLQF